MRQGINGKRWTQVQRYVMYVLLIQFADLEFWSAFTLAGLLAWPAMCTQQVMLLAITVIVNAAGIIACLHALLVLAPADVKDDFVTCMFLLIITSALLELVSAGAWPTMLLTPSVLSEGTCASPSSLNV